MKKGLPYYDKFWKIQSLEQKRDLLRKHYPNDQNKWSITTDMKIYIYRAESYNVLNK